MGVWPDRLLEAAAEDHSQPALVQVHEHTWRGGRWLKHTARADWLVGREALLDGGAATPTVGRAWLQGVLPKV